MNHTKTGGERGCSGRVSSTSDTRRVNLGTNPGINHECELDSQCMKLPY